MKSVVFSTAILAALLFAASGSAQAQFGGLLKGSKSDGTESAGAVDPDAFLERAMTAEALLDASLDNMTKALVSGDELTKLKALEEAANAKTNPKERAAATLELKKSKTAAINDQVGKASFESDAKALSAERQENLGASGFNFALGVLQQKALAEESTGLVSAMGSNPANLSKLGKVKDAATSIKNQLVVLGALATKMPKVVGLVKGKMPSSKDDKPAQIKAVSGD